MGFRLLVDAPFPEDATSYYRAWGPLTELRKMIPDLELVSFHTLSSHPSGTRVAWPEIRNVDGVFLQRPSQEDRVMMAHITKAYKKKLWVDFDDDILAVPHDNPTHQIYEQPQVKRSVEQICKIADIITTSTKVLGEKMANFNPKVLVVPNALDMGLLDRMDEALPRNRFVIWRGSHCHFTDLHEYSKEILDAYNQFPDWGWCFVGYNPTWITKDMDCVKRTRIMHFDNDYLNYIHNLQKLRGAVQIVPLVDIPFNRAKSRIAHLESSLSGSVCLAPDFEEWQGNDNMYRYSNPVDFKAKLFQLLQTPLEQLAETNNKDWNWIETHRCLRSTNEFRRGIIQAFRNAV